MTDCFDLFPGNLAVNLGYFDQDIYQQVDKGVMGFGLGFLIGAYLAPDIKSKGPEPRNTY